MDGWIDECIDSWRGHARKAENGIGKRKADSSRPAPERKTENGKRNWISLSLPFHVLCISLGSPFRFLFISLPFCLIWLSFPFRVHSIFFISLSFPIRFSLIPLSVSFDEIGPASFQRQRRLQTRNAIVVAQTGTRPAKLKNRLPAAALFFRLGAVQPPMARS